jgi:hypothetical protein
VKSFVLTIWELWTPAKAIADELVTHMTMGKGIGAARPQAPLQAAVLDGEGGEFHCYEHDYSKGPKVGT